MLNGFRQNDHRYVSAIRYRISSLVWHEPQFDQAGKPTPNKLPERYAKPEASPLKATVRSGNNTLDLDLSR